MKPYSWVYTAIFHHKLDVAYMRSKKIWHKYGTNRSRDSGSQGAFSCYIASFLSIRTLTLTMNEKKWEAWFHHDSAKYTDTIQKYG